jgi:hypothetical protein
VDTVRCLRDKRDVTPKGVNECPIRVDLGSPDVFRKEDSVIDSTPAIIPETIPRQVCGGASAWRNAARGGRPSAGVLRHE